MKGKQLYRRDILNLKDGDKVWVEYMNYDNSKDGVETIKEEKSYSSDDRFMYLTDMAEEFFENNLAVYEYIEETQTEQTITKTDKETNTYIKTYKGSEILAMIDDGRLKDDDTVVGKDGAQYLIKHLRKLAVVEILVSQNSFHGRTNSWVGYSCKT
jgi:translation initiation factor IF-1